MKQEKNELVIKVRELLEIIPPLVFAWSYETSNKSIDGLVVEYERATRLVKRIEYYYKTMLLAFSFGVVSLVYVGPIFIGYSVVLSVISIVLFLVLTATASYHVTKNVTIKKKIEPILLLFIHHAENISPPFEVDGLTPVAVYSRANAFKFVVVREKLTSLAMNKIEALAKFDHFRLLPTRMLDAIMIAGEQVRKVESEFNVAWESAIAFALVVQGEKPHIFADADRRIAEAKKK